MNSPLPLATRGVCLTFVLASRRTTEQVLKLELTDEEIVDMAKAVDDDGSGDMGFNEFLEVIMIVNEMKKLGCSRAEVMLPGNPDSEFFMWERSGEGRHVGKEMADVTVRKLFQGLPPDRLSEVCAPAELCSVCPRLCMPPAGILRYAASQLDSQNVPR